jgi:ribonuclease P protein component
VFRVGTRFEGRQVQIIATPAASGTGRFGLVVGRKALPRAIERNRFKRLVREAMRVRREQAARYDVVIRLKVPVKRPGVDAAAAEAASLLTRAFASLDGADRP